MATRTQGRLTTQPEHPNAHQWSHAQDFDADEYDAEGDLFQQVRYRKPVERVSIFDRTLVGGFPTEIVAEAVDLTDPFAVRDLLNTLEQRDVAAANYALEQAEEGSRWSEDDREPSDYDDPASEVEAEDAE